MSGNKKTIVFPHETSQPGGNSFISVNNEGLVQHDIWMEFEESYIEILSGSGVETE